MTPREFYEMRLKHFFMKLQEYNRHRENETRMNAELVRLQTTALINVQLKPADKINPQQLWRLPWDDENATEKTMNQLSKEELQQAYTEYIEKVKF